MVPGAPFVGNPDTVLAQIAAVHEILAPGRAARLADGFKFIAPSFNDLDRVGRTIEALRTSVAAGRDPEAFGTEVRIIAQLTTPDDWPGLIDRMRGYGATHVGFANRIAGGTVAAQLEILQTFVSATGDRWD